MFLILKYSSSRNVFGPSFIVEYGDRKGRMSLDSLTTPRDRLEWDVTPTFLEDWRHSRRCWSGLESHQLVAQDSQWLHFTSHFTAPLFSFSFLSCFCSPLQLPRVDSTSDRIITSCSSTNLIKLNTCLVLVGHQMICIQFITDDLIIGVSSLSLNHGHNGFELNGVYLAGVALISITELTAHPINHHARDSWPQLYKRWRGCPPKTD